jgi:xanthine dehydrogenase FAD-binding subunit
LSQDDPVSASGKYTVEKCHPITIIKREYGDQMSLWNTYLQPKSVEEALDCLQNAAGSTAVIAGGTDLLLDMKQGRHASVDTMVDVAGIAEMQKVEQDGDLIYLGASVTHYEIITHPLMLAHAQSLVDGSGLVGGPQVRNVATIGGNVAHALPAGDGTIALLALGAEAQIASKEGRRWVALEGLFAGPGKPTFDRSCEILVGFRIPVTKAGEASGSQRIMRPQGVAIAILNMSAWVRFEDGKIGDVRLAVGPAGPVPFRARATEDFLRGRVADDDTLAAAVEVLRGEVSLRTSAHRATKEYRRHILPVLLRRVIRLAETRSQDEAAPV